MLSSVIASNMSSRFMKQAAPLGPTTQQRPTEGQQPQPAQQPPQPSYVSMPPGPVCKDSQYIIFDTKIKHQTYIQLPPIFEQLMSFVRVRLLDIETTPYDLKHL